MFSVIDVWEKNSGFDCPFIWKPEIHKGDATEGIVKQNKSYEEMDCGCGEDWKFFCKVFSSLEEAIKFVDPMDTGYYYNFTEGGE